MKALSKRSLSVFGLVMMNVIAIDSLRSLPMSAEYGFSIIAYYTLTAIMFFLPTAFVAAELATGWPETGGIYVWVREAFGKQFGFLIIWLQWFYNICWYPTIMSLIAATLAYCINPNLVHSKLYMLSVVMIVFWTVTFINCRGIQASSRLCNISAIVGTMVPMFFIIVLGVIWFAMGKPIQVNMSWHTLIPHVHHASNLVMLTAVLYGFVGMEMSAAHAGDVKNPSRDYPKAMFWSILIILTTMTFATLAVEFVIPAKQLNIVAGLLQAFAAFFSAFHMTWMTPIVALMIVFGAIGGAAAWMVLRV